MVLSRGGTNTIGTYLAILLDSTLPFVFPRSHISPTLQLASTDLRRGPPINRLEGETKEYQYHILFENRSYVYLHRLEASKELLANGFEDDELLSIAKGDR